MFFRTAWSLVLRKGGLGIRGIHSPGDTGKTWTASSPNSKARARSYSCKLPLVPSMLPWAYPKTFPTIFIPWSWATFFQEIVLKGQADSSPLHPSFLRA